MTRIFVSLKEFDTLWKSVGLDDWALREIETFLIKNPKYGNVISGTNGLRKMRWALPGKGKSGGIRVLYVDFPDFEILYFVSLIKKNEKENISKDDKKTITQIISLIEKSLTIKKRKGDSDENNKRKK